MGSKKWKAIDMPDQSGKIVIVTGANSGTGFEAIKAFARKGAHVVMACRNLEKAEKAKSKIINEIPSASLEIIELDLSDLSKVRSFVVSFRNSHDSLDILCNNAGIMIVPKRIETVDGFELQLASNHFGHFALTGLLFDLLMKSGGRVVNMSSSAHRFGKIDFSNCNWEKDKSYSSTGAYGRSKIANLYFTYELNRHVNQNNINVQVLASHPGWSRTNLQSTGLSTGKKTIGSRITRLGVFFLNPFLGQSAEKGALPMLYAATHPEVQGGDYYGPGGFQESRGYPKKVSSNGRSKDEPIAKELWEVSTKLTGITYSF